MADHAPPRQPAGRPELGIHRVGVQSDVAWIAQNTPPGLGISSSVPRVFAAYATIVVPEGPEAAQAHDEALLEILGKRSPRQTWWLGFLDTGGDDVVLDDAPRVRLYGGWQYVLVEAGPDRAGIFRSGGPRTLPDLLHPTDRSWLLSTLWDDDWRCLGGPAALVDALRQDPRLDVRQVGPDEDATPPGHVAR